MNPLFHYINNYASISEKDFTIFISHFIYKKIRKKRYLLEEGEICKHMAFILKGSMRQYYIDEKGVEHVINLFIEDWWAGDRESFFMRTPSIYYVDAWEDCEVYLVSREKIIQLRDEFPAFNEMVLKLDEQNTIATQRRITASISLTAEKKYMEFLDRYPEFIQRFPQYLIASYLGITKDTLSRVRKKTLRR